MIQQEDEPVQPPLPPYSFIILLNSIAQYFNFQMEVKLLNG